MVFPWMGGRLRMLVIVIRLCGGLLLLTILTLKQPRGEDFVLARNFGWRETLTLGSPVSRFFQMCSGPSCQSTTWIGSIDKCYEASC